MGAVYAWKEGEMKVKCLECGFTYEMKGTGEEMCPKCGCRHWSMRFPEEIKMVKDLLLERINNIKI